MFLGGVYSWAPCWARQLGLRPRTGLEAAVAQKSSEKKLSGRASEAMPMLSASRSLLLSIWGEALFAPRETNPTSALQDSTHSAHLTLLEPTGCTTAGSWKEVGQQRVQDSASHLQAAFCLFRPLGTIASLIDSQNLTSVMGTSCGPPHTISKCGG